MKEQPYFQKTFICYLRFHDTCQSSDNRIRTDFKLELIYHLVDFIQKHHLVDLKITLQIIIIEILKGFHEQDSSLILVRNNLDMHNLVYFISLSF